MRMPRLFQPLMALSVLFAVFLGGAGDSFAQGANCSEDSLSKNSEGY